MTKIDLEDLDSIDKLLNIIRDKQHEVEQLNTRYDNMVEICMRMR